MAPSLRSDLNIVQLPTTFPNVGGLLGKNTVVIDPDFGTQLVRATDGSSGAGNFKSMQTTDSPSGYSMWNTDDTMFLSGSTGGNSFLFQFNPTTMQSTQLGTSGFYKIPGPYCFSRVHNGILYTVNGTVVNSYTYALISGVWTYQSTATICDFASILPGGFVVNWHSAFTIGLGDNMFGMAFSQGNQDTGFNACVYKPGSGFRMINTQTLAVTGDWGPTGTATLSNTNFTNFFLHGINIPPNGNYMLLSAVGSGPTKGEGSFVWDLSTLSLVQDGLSGHHGLGYLSLYTGNPGGGQYDQCFYATPTVNTIVIPKQAGPPGLPAYQTPKQTYKGDQHSAFSPVDTSDHALLYITNGAPSIFPFTSCWMGELRALDVSGAISGQQGIVYRVCHTFNSGKSKEYVTANAQIGASQTGNFVAFNSDWAGAGTVGPLGSTSGAPTGTVGVDARGDVFIARIPLGGTIPSITSANNATFAQNTFGSFTVNTIGSPTPSIGESGSLPTGVTFVDNGNGTATLSGTPTVNGTFPLTITATNSAGSANQPFTLTVTPAPVQVAPNITSANTTSFRRGILSAFNVTTTGTPTAAITEAGTLPAGISFADHGNGTGSLGGTPTSPVGTYPLTFTAANGVLPNAVQPFTLKIVAPIAAGVVSGTFQYPNGSPVANGSYQFRLTADAINFSVACTVPTLIGGSLDQNGSLSATFTFNDQLQTVLGFNTNYQLTIKDKAGKQVWNEHYYLTGTAANLTTIAPSGGGLSA